MVSKIIIIILLILLVISPLALALDINIKTLPEHRISVIIREAEKLTTLESFHNDTGNGELVINAVGAREHIDLIVTLKKDGESILNQKFESISTNEPIYIDFIPGEVELTTGNLPAEELVTTDETVNETEVIPENETEQPIEETAEPKTEVVDKVPEETENTVQSGKITGAAISNIKSFASSKTSYYIGGIILAIIALLFIVHIVKRKISPKETSIKIRKLNKDESSNSSELENIEKKIDEAKKELDNIKNKKNRLQEVRDRIKKDQEELKQLED